MIEMKDFAFYSFVGAITILTLPIWFPLLLIFGFVICLKELGENIMSIIRGWLD